MATNMNQAYPNRTHSSYKNSPSLQLPRNMQRDVYLVHDARQNLQQLSYPFDAHDVLQHSWDRAQSTNSVRWLRDGSYAFQIITRSARPGGVPVIAVMWPNRNPGRQPWAITYLGYDTHHVLNSF